MYVFRESSRVVLIPFQAPQLQARQLDDSDLLCRCRDAGDAVAIFVKLGKMFQVADRGKVDQRVSELLSQEKMDVTVRVRRTYTILLLFTLMERIDNFSVS